MLLNGMDADRKRFKPTIRGKTVQDLEDIRQAEKLHSRTEAIGFLAKFYKMAKVHEKGIKLEVKQN